MYRQHICHPPFEHNLYSCCFLDSRSAYPRVSFAFITIAMGKRKAGFRKNRRDNKVSRVDSEIKPYSSIERDNEKFVQYYKTVGICSEEEWDEFLKFMKMDLPSTFRITGSRSEALKMVDIVQGEYLQNYLNGESLEENKNSIFPLPWYPNKLAWQMSLTKKDIRRGEEFLKLHNFLMSETEHGTISRQETVSMIPPIALDVKPHHKVLDMCAAPGSKTAQLLEFLHANSEEEPIPSGYVIANDIDNKRCYMLVHQAKRLKSPCMAVTNHDSAILPNFTASLPDGSTEQVQFDRVLCDVPCSGDGTLRKNPDIWMKWTPANAINLHGIQSRILRRGCELLKVGGRLVYSTCSLNPMENEAVIHRLLAETDGAVHLVDVSKEFPGLKYAPGMESWLVGSRNLEFYKTWNDVDEKWRTTIRPQMFPPTEEDRAKFNLRKCMRILPHQQDTGAFFVAVLEKLKPLNPKEKSFKITNEEKKDDDADERLPKNQRKRRRKGYREDPFVFFTGDEDVWLPIKDFYHIDDEFDPKCLLVRCNEGKKKNIYVTSEAVRDLILQNQGTIKFINSGVKLFVRSDNRNLKECKFRIAFDGLDSIFKSIGRERKVNIGKTDLTNILYYGTPDEALTFDKLSEELQKQVLSMDPGSCILIYEEEKDDPLKLVLHLSGWRGANTLRVYMPQCSMVHLLRLLGGDTSKFDIKKTAKEVVKDTEVKQDVSEDDEMEKDVIDDEKDENVVDKSKDSDGKEKGAVDEAKEEISNRTSTI